MLHLLLLLDVSNVEELREAMQMPDVEAVKVIEDLVYDDSITYMYDRLEALTPLVKKFLSITGDCVDGTWIS